MDVFGYLPEKEELAHWLTTEDAEAVSGLFAAALAARKAYRGSKVYLRGLIELSNICVKDCLYCGLRSSNRDVQRYELEDEKVYSEAMFAWKEHYGSLVIQSGERTDARFVDRITRLVRKIKELSSGRLGITLSCGEQRPEVYREWFEAGAHRYLLRIESSDPDLYRKIHPDNPKHSFDRRLACLGYLRDAGYKVGTGVMIGLPFQTPMQLAGDLLFFKNIDVDMVGMGPYLEHDRTPLYAFRNRIPSPERRLDLSLRMVALLRLLMPEINIAATTAMQVLDPLGREKAIMAGANVIMPNMTDPENRESYQIYNNKPGLKDDAAITKSRIVENLAAAGISIGWDEWGDSQKVH